MPSNIVKDFAMSKNKSTAANTEAPATIPQPAPAPTPQPTPTYRFGLIITRIVLWLIFIAVIAYLWLKPEIVYNIVNHFSRPLPAQIQAPVSAQDEEQAARLRRLNNRLNEVERRLDKATLSSPDSTAAEAAVAELNQRLNNFEKQNIAIIDSKADAASVLSLTNRLDKIEQRLDNMAKISDQGALIITTVMMIKDAAERGNSFTYEAEVLSLLTQKENSLQSPVAELLKFADKKLPSKAELTHNFDSLYQEISAAEEDKALEGKDWKQRLNMKLSEYVTVKRTKPEANETANEPQNILSELKQNVDTAHFAQAISLLQTPEGQTLSQAYPSLHGWQAEASAHVDFYQAIGQISTYSLALMKLNYVHPENTNNLNQ